MEAYAWLQDYWVPTLTASSTSWEEYKEIVLHIPAIPQEVINAFGPDEYFAPHIILYKEKNTSSNVSSESSGFRAAFGKTYDPSTGRYDISYTGSEGSPFNVKYNSKPDGNWDIVSGTYYGDAELGRGVSPLVPSRTKMSDYATATQITFNFSTQKIHANDTGWYYGDLFNHYCNYNVSARIGVFFVVKNIPIRTGTMPYAGIHCNAISK